MNPYRFNLSFVIFKVTLLCLALLLVIVAFSSPEIPTVTSATIDYTGLINQPSSFLRSGTGSAMSSARFAAPIPKAVSLMRSGPPPPPLLYGTAWKTDRTEEFVFMAVQNGFRGIDTACQPKHYYEPGVGNALVRIYALGQIRREDMFIQTKYTPFSGQDKNNVPYDKDAKLSDQVIQSFHASLSNLQTDYLDSLVLHSPLEEHKDTMEVWRALEHIHSIGGTRFLGISNCYEREVLSALYAEASVKPSFLQNRFYGESGHDRDIRKFCDENGIIYQGFWTLTANPRALER